MTRRSLTPMECVVRALHAAADDDRAGIARELMAFATAALVVIDGGDAAAAEVYRLAHAVASREARNPGGADVLPLPTAAPAPVKQGPWRGTQAAMTEAKSRGSLVALPIQRFIPPRYRARFDLEPPNLPQP